MIYRVWHRTTYDYEDPVSVSHHLVRLTPRNLPGQVCRETGLTIRPAPLAPALSSRATGGLPESSSMLASLSPRHRQP